MKSLPRAYAMSKHSLIVILFYFIILYIHYSMNPSISHL